jgi:UDP-N-acetylmuramate: L-alanyl-gamma-D-glutamyl-meso-diaminopimelate ligase
MSAQAKPPAQWMLAGDGTLCHADANDGAPDDAGVVVGRIECALPGQHNRLNALAALVAARHAGVPVADSLRALAAFRGVRRRMELRGRVNGIAVYDDFAHHPTAIAATLEGLREREPAGRILAVLEPRSNTMKLGTMKAALPGSLAAADAVFCYAAKLGFDAAAALEPLRDRAHVTDDLDRLVDAVVAESRPGDRIVVMSNGGFGGVHGRLLEALAASIR